MSKKVIHGNTKKGEAEDYSFEFKKRTTDNTKMYHIKLSRKVDYKSGERMLTRVESIVKLYTPVDYKKRFIPEVTVANGVERDRGNTNWHKQYSLMDGSPGIEMLFNPTLYTEEEEDTPVDTEPTEFDFTSKSQVTQASNDVLLDYCQGHYELHEFEGMSGVKMKELIIEKLNF